MNIIALDAQHYDGGLAGVGMLGFDHWSDGRAAWEIVVVAHNCGEYEPGAFYKRELPALTQALAQCPSKPDIIVVDAYVVLDNEGRPGLGYKLWEALEKTIPVIGVAKTKFMNAPTGWEVQRGASKSPLFVTAIGVEQSAALSWVASMHGEFRMPTLLKRVDQLARTPLASIVLAGNRSGFAP